MQNIFIKNSLTGLPTGFRKNKGQGDVFLLKYIRENIDMFVCYTSHVPEELVLILANLKNYGICTVDCKNMINILYT